MTAREILIKHIRIGIPVPVTDQTIMALEGFYSALDAMDEYGKMCFEAAREEVVESESASWNKYEDYEDFKDSKEGK